MNNAENQKPVHGVCVVIVAASGARCSVEKFILYSRETISIVLSSFLVAAKSLDTLSLSEGIGLYDGLFYGIFLAGESGLGRDRAGLLRDWRLML